MLSVGEGIQDAWESVHIHFEVTILRCDARSLHYTFACTIICTEVYTGIKGDFQCRCGSVGVSDHTQM